MSLSALLVKTTFSCIYWSKIEIQCVLSLGYDSVSNPNLWVESSSIQNGNATTSTNIAAWINSYATDGLKNNTNLEITATSTITNSITASTVRVSSRKNLDSTGLDQLTIKTKRGRLCTEPQQ